MWTWTIEEVAAELAEPGESVHWIVPVRHGYPYRATAVSGEGWSGADTSPTGVIVLTPKRIVLGRVQTSGFFRPRVVGTVRDREFPLDAEIDLEPVRRWQGGLSTLIWGTMGDWVRLGDVRLWVRPTDVWRAHKARNEARRLIRAMLDENEDG